jgi:hypothetical protein
VVILPDNDEPGRKHAEQIAEALHGIAASVLILELPDLPPKGDVSDWFSAGGTASKLYELVAQARQAEAGKEQQDETTITAAALMDAEIKEVACVIESAIPEGMSILAGKPKLGKSWMAMALGLDVALGTKALGQLGVQSGDVLYLALEDTRHRLRRRLLKLLPNGERPTRMYFQTTWPRQDQGGLEAIEEFLIAHPDTRLIVIDTWAKFRPAKGGNKDAYELDYLHASEVKAIADKYHIAIVIVCHCRKVPADDPVDSVSGTLGLTGCADAVLVLKRERGQHDAALFVTGRDIEEQELALRWNATTARWALLGGADEYRISRERAQIMEVLRKAGRPLSPTEAAPLVNKKVGAVKWLLWNLEREGWVSVQDGRYCPKDNANCTEK